MENAEFINAVVSEFEKEHLSDISDQTHKIFEKALAEDVAKVFLICERIKKEQK